MVGWLNTTNSRSSTGRALDNHIFPLRVQTPPGVVRAISWKRYGSGWLPSRAKTHVAQWLEHYPNKVGVAGSIPAVSSKDSRSSAVSSDVLIRHRSWVRIPPGVIVFTLRVKTKKMVSSLISFLDERSLRLQWIKFRNAKGDFSSRIWMGKLSSFTFTKKNRMGSTLVDTTLPKIHQK